MSGCRTRTRSGLVPGYHGAAYLGVAYNPFVADGDPNSRRLPRARTSTLPGGLDPARLDGRRGLLGAFDSRPADVDALGPDGRPGPVRPAGVHDGDRPRGPRGVRHPQGRPAAPRPLRPPHRGARAPCWRRRLVEAGVRFVTLTFGGWDYHSSLETGMHNGPARPRRGRRRAWSRTSTSAGCSTRRWCW